MFKFISAIALTLSFATPATAQTYTSAQNQLFFDSFVNTASPSALEAASQMPVARIIVLGQTVCNSIERTGSIDSSNRFLLGLDLPIPFIASVQVNAVRNYCPQYSYLLAPRR